MHIMMSCLHKKMSIFVSKFIIVAQRIMGEGQLVTFPKIEQSQFYSNLMQNTILGTIRHLELNQVTLTHKFCEMFIKHHHQRPFLLYRHEPKI